MKIVIDYFDSNLLEDPAAINFNVDDYYYYRFSEKSPQIDALLNKLSIEMGLNSKNYFNGVAMRKDSNTYAKGTGTGLKSIEHYVMLVPEKNLAATPKRLGGFIIMASDKESIGKVVDFLNILLAEENIEAEFVDKIPEADAWQEFIIKIKNSDPKYRLLNLSDENLAEKQLLELFDALKNNRVVSVLNLNGNKISLDAARGLASLLRLNTLIGNLSIAETQLSDFAAVEILTAVAANNKLTTFNLSDNNISDVVGVMLTHLLKDNTNIIRFVYSGNSFNEHTCRYFESLISANLDKVAAIEIQQLNFLTNRSKPNLNPLLERIRNNDPTLTAVDLSDYTFTGNEFDSVMALLQSNHIVKSIALEGTLLTESMALSLSNFLSRNSKITSLSISESEVKETDLRVILSALMHNKTLSSLDISEIDLSEELGDLLLSIITNNKTITELEFDSGYFSDETADAIERISSVQFTRKCT